MTNPLFWLSLSMGLLALSVLLLLLVAIPVVLGMARVARSAEKLLDVLHQELPSTLHALRQTGANLSDLAEDVNEGVQGAGHVVKHVDQSLTQASQQAQQAQITTRSLWAGLNVAWRVFMHRPRSKRRQRPPTRRPSTPPPLHRSPRILALSLRLSLVTLKPRILIFALPTRGPFSLMPTQRHWLHPLQLR
ncbi:MAG: DUF948 domain-containing protein [Cyanobacteria bacterium P01_F01_bin.4]